MRHTLYPIILALLSLLSSCGQPVGFMGLGDCAAMFANAPTSTGATGTLTINSGGVTTFRLGIDHPVFSTSGGTSPYTWSVTTGSCGTFPTPSSGTFNLTTTSTLCTIQVTDSTSPNANYGTLNITVTN